MSEQVRFPVPAYVIEAGDERILVDTGFSPAQAESPAAYYDNEDALGMFQLEQEQSVAEQLDLSTVGKVVLTHLHFDHAGGLSLLPDSVPVYVQRTEWEAGKDADAIAKNFFMPLDYESAAGQVKLVDGDHDLLGDGSVMLISTPGHTPGHQSVQVGEQLVIGGDAIHYASGLDDQRFPVFAADHDEQAASADRLKALRDAGAVVTSGHDPDELEPGQVPA
jgi:glyoxylase-like metal-dependent hydrolase (beta-lactamase superfamily II)